VLGGLEFASEEKQPLEVRVIFGLIRFGASCDERFRLHSNLLTSRGLECASEAKQPFELQVILGHA
jgi:hypothetical protein